MKSKKVYFLFKRIFDIFFSSFGILALLPLFLLISILIKITSKGPVFFVQKRVGKNGKLFNLYKFRTMFLNAEKMGASITSKDDKRITKIGFFLRKYKIDEFPQLFNVLKGDISFVGPRPELQKFVEYYKNDYEEILKIKPGITDYAAIKFSNENDLIRDKENPEAFYVEKILPEKIKLYKKYLSEMNLINDVKIIFLTIINILKAK
jgi:lipopolysaccharide/colanic/teichoic acid biosynthesis glycosyltransferase